jgi:hypothetical protein
MDTKRCHTLIREWWKEQMGDLDMVDPKEMADYAIEAMLQDATFLARFSEEFLRPVVLDVAREVFASGRRAYKEQEPKPFVWPTLREIATGDMAQRIEEDAPKRDMTKWFEHDPKTGKYLRLGIMVKEQCLAAAESRERRATGDLTRAGMLRMVAGRLAPGQRVSEVWSEEELERLEQQITVERPVYGINGKTILDIMREVA